MPEITAGMQPIGQYLPTKVFKPDMALVEKALGLRQKEYDTKLSMFKKVKAKVDEVNALEEDKDRYFEKQQEYADKIDEISNMYGGDLTKADAEFSDLIDEVGKDFGIHGEFRAMDNNYTSAMKNFAELKKRREKNEITEGQFRTWHRALRNYQGIGKDPKHWNTWSTVSATDAVDISKFLNDFIKNEKASAAASGYTTRTRNGMLEYLQGNVVVLTEADIQRHAEQALRKKLDETGQVNADFLWDLERGKFNIPTKESFLDVSTKQIEKYDEAINVLSTAKGRDLVNAINGLYGENVLIPGDNSSDLINRYAQDLIDKFSLAKRGIEEEIKDTKDLDDITFQKHQMHRKHYEDEFLEEWVSPWARAASYHEYKNDLKVHKSPAVEFAYKQRLMERGHQLKLDFFKEAYKIEDDEVMASTYTIEGTKSKGPIGNMKDYKTKTKELADQEETLINNFKVELATIGMPESQMNNIFSKFEKVMGRPFSARDMRNLKITTAGTNQLKFQFLDDNGNPIDNLIAPEFLKTKQQKTTETGEIIAGEYEDVTIDPDSYFGKFKTRASHIVNTHNQYEAFRNQTLQKSCEELGLDKETTNKILSLDKNINDPVWVKQARLEYARLVGDKGMFATSDPKLHTNADIYKNTEKDFQKFLKNVDKYGYSTVIATYKRNNKISNQKFAEDFPLLSKHSNDAGDTKKARTKATTRRNKVMKEAQTIITSFKTTDHWGGKNNTENKEIGTYVDKQFRDSQGQYSSYVGDAIVSAPNDPRMQRILNKAAAGGKLNLSKAISIIEGMTGKYTVTYTGVKNLVSSNRDLNEEDVASPVASFSITDKDGKTQGTLQFIVSSGVSIPVGNSIALRAMKAQNTYMNGSDVGKLNQIPDQDWTSIDGNENVIRHIPYRGSDSYIDEATGMEVKYSPEQTMGHVEIRNKRNGDVTKMGVKEFTNMVGIQKAFNKIMNDSHILPVSNNQSDEMRRRNGVLRKFVLDQLTGNGNESLNMLDKNFNLKGDWKNEDDAATVLYMRCRIQSDGGGVTYPITKKQAGALLQAVMVGYKQAPDRLTTVRDNVYRTADDLYNFEGLY